MHVAACLPRVHSKKGMDKGLVTIETQARLRDGKHEVQHQVLPVSVSQQGEITTYFLHEQLLRTNHAQDGREGGAEHSSTAAGLLITPPPHDGVAGGLYNQAASAQQQRDLFTSKQAFMAELCQKVAAEGFEPIQNVFAFSQW